MTPVLLTCPNPPSVPSGSTGTEVVRTTKPTPQECVDLLGVRDDKGQDLLVRILLHTRETSVKDPGDTSGTRPEFTGTGCPTLRLNVVWTVCDVLEGRTATRKRLRQNRGRTLTSVWSTRTHSGRKTFYTGVSESRRRRTSTSTSDVYQVPLNLHTYSLTVAEEEVRDLGSLTSRDLDTW